MAAGGSAAAAAAAGSAATSQQPLLTYWDRNPPYAAVALAAAAGVEVPHAADPKATKETLAKLQFPSGCVARRGPVRLCARRAS
jgi:hypothetical protein